MNYKIEEIIAVNDLYHTLLWEQRQGRHVSEMMVSDKIYEMLAGENMDRTSFSVSMKLSQIQAVRTANKLDGLDCLIEINNWQDIDYPELMSLIGSYEYLFKCMDEESAGETRAS